MTNDTNHPRPTDDGWEALDTGDWTALDTTPGCASNDVEALRAALIDASKL